MGRKERAAARRRHAIQRARAASGVSPKSKPDRPAAKSGSRSPSRNGARGPRPAGQRPGLRKMVAGERDARGRVYERSMLLHPGVALLLSMGLLGAALLSTWKLRNMVLTYALMAPAALLMADSQPRKRTAWLFVGLAGLMAALAGWILVAGVIVRG